MFAPRLRPPAQGPEPRTDLPSAAARSAPSACSRSAALPCACARCSEAEAQAGPNRAEGLPDLTRIPAVARERDGWTADGLAAVQTKLPVARPDDPLEVEADRVADRIMAGGAAGALAPPTGAPGPALQAKPAGATPVAAAVPGLGSGGRPLSAGDRSWFEPRFGSDFGDVRIHDDASASSAAEAIGALAYTSGSHIVFARDRYAPGTDAGRRLLAHELTHVVQQRGGSRPQAAPSAVSSPIPVSTARADGAIYRQVASACHPTARWPGNIEHELIEDDYVTNINPTSGALEYAIPGSGPNGGVGYADMVDTATHKIYEIKTFPGAAAGVAQAQNYADMANANCPAPIPQSPWTVGNDYPAHTILISATEAITVRQYPQFPGVVVYNRRKRPQRVPVPVRRRAPRTAPQNAPQQQPAPQPQQQPQPQPQPLPVPVMQQIEEFLHQVVETGANAEQAANRFLRDHPELVYVVAGLSITIFLATIAEDILTLGAGIADDPATMGAAWALWQAARAMQAAR